MIYKQKKYCRCCKSEKLFSYIDLGSQPLANSYHKKEKLQMIPLNVVLCLECFHSQLSVVVDPDYMFRNYLYVSGTTNTFTKHTKNLAVDAVSRFKKKNLEVLDVACNDGTQLDHFRDLGCRVTGVDPAKNLRRITKKKNIDVYVDYWTRKLAKKIKKRFDIITATNVFAHVDDIDEFLLASKDALKEDGILILEFPYANNLIKNNEFDTVYHEHLSYFLVNSLKTAVERLGFFISDIIRSDIHGGSIRFFLKTGSSDHVQKVSRLITEEKNTGLLKKSTYVLYEKRVKKNKETMVKLIQKLNKDGEKVIGYGASAKGNTMLNYFKIKLDYIVDDNPLKWGYLTPGMNIPIKDPEFMAKEKGILHIVVLSWNFYEEIVGKIKRIRPSKDNYTILYVPSVKVEKI